MQRKKDKKPNSTTDGDIDQAYAELFEIQKQRFLLHMRKIERVIKKYGLPKISKEDHFRLAQMREVIGHQIALQLIRYKKKYPRWDYLKDIMDADKDDPSLFRIVSVDKAWLFTKRIKARILMAQEDGDIEFFKRLGDAVSKEPQIKPLRNKADDKERQLHQDILDYSEAYLDSRYPKRTLIEGLPPEAISKLHESIKSVFPSVEKANDAIPIIKSIDTFNVFLRRNYITIPFTLNYIKKHKLLVSSSTRQKLGKHSQQS